MGRILAIGFVCVVLCGGVVIPRAVHQAQVQAKAVNTSDAAAQGARERADDKAQAIENVGQSLRDPGSMEVQDVVAYYDTQRTSVATFCGEVNAKNSFGGYDGFTRFITGTKGPVIFEKHRGFVVDEFFVHQYSAQCRSYATFKERMAALPGIGR